MSQLTLKPMLRQELKLTPQLLQSMEILQMNSQELLDYLSRTGEENPVIEQEESREMLLAYAQLQQKVNWLDRGSTANSFSHGELTPPEVQSAESETESLSFFLRDQLDRLNLPKQLAALTHHLAELVDEDGYLTNDDVKDLAKLKIPAELIAQAVHTIQMLDPAGVGARSLEECLILQLQRMKLSSDAPVLIVQHHLQDLSRKHYGPIQKALGLPLEEILEAEKVIAALDPRPGRAFLPESPVAYIRPDIFIADPDGTLTAIVNEYYLPRITISSYYTRLSKESDEPETHAYLRGKIQQARWLLNAMERRSNTLQRCADAILQAQFPFFSGETSELTPMGLADLARQLGLHMSTVSRATHGKYLQCRQGIFPLRYFFSRSVGGVSRQAIKQQLLQLVKQENPVRPLSDQALANLLSTDSAAVARRTVAKYRMELGIGSSSARKRQPRSK